ncbi:MULTISPECIES: DHH family phosphoesterase [Flavobacteriaceae]|uniref:Bifunctional oligoribonuclease/PAP phosphatase NrnA n=2 Tax=Flavobacteriaceae TaxID=49546 RepID=A0A4Y8AY81_9FLAO|nr:MULTISPECIES: bifunctional oligoribonuclease/PAP phosphatase NrnA [Flavobacteriaceae]TEW76858.1 bifunctional oligoribonuclease/PAP phosphatase NrnA [Gramella jeungdoensis]GGK49459.1 exopolyphosphatase [Lutibacter litoralis]
MNVREIIEIKELLSTPKNIVIVPHRNPDGDAIGSSLAIYNYLQKEGHNATVVAPNDYPDFLKWLPNSKEVLKFDMQNRQSKKAIEKASIIFLLDFNALHRVGSDMENTLNEFEGEFIMIDHHQEPDSVAKYLFSDTSICSTCQMVYHFLEKLDAIDEIDAPIATALYTGIMTDTGSFRFASTTSTTHKIIADLIDKGANNALIHNNVYDTNSYGRLQLLGRALTNLTVIEKLKTAYIILTQQDLDDFNYQKGDTEGVVNYALSLEGVIFAVIFIEDIEQKIIKISFRSKGSFSVNKFARNHFNGGGHDNAAGGRSEISLEATVSEFLNVLPEYKIELLNSYEA